MRAPTCFLSPFLLFLFTSFVCTVPIPACTGDTGQAAASPKQHRNQQKKVFTNEDLQGLPSGFDISTFLPSAEVVSPPPKGEQRPAAGPGQASVERKPYIKEADPGWYLEQLDAARTELESIDSKAQRLREFRKSGMGMTGGITWDQPSLRLSPENEAEQLTLRRQEIESQIAELEDTARHNGLSPGLLRGSLSANAPHERPLGPREHPPSPEQERTAWQEKLRPLLEELAQVEGAVERMEKEAAARGMTLYPITIGGSPTADLLRRLKARASAVQSKISSIEDEARHAGVPPGWLR